MATIVSRVRRIAKRTGLTPGHVSRVLNGRRKPSFGTLKKIAAAMNVSESRLVRIIEERAAEPVPEEVSAAIRKGLLKRQADITRANDLAGSDFVDQTPLIEDMDYGSIK